MKVNREVVKTVGTALATYGVGSIIEQAARNNAPEDMGTIKKVCVAAGVWILAGMVVEKAIDYTHKELDVIADHVERITGEQPEQEQLETTEEKCE